MSEKINWKNHIIDFKRGETIMIACDEPFAEIDSTLVKYWNTLFEIAMKHGKADYNIKVEVGIWLINGEIITLIHDAREFCRLSYENKPLAKEYLDFPDVNDRPNDFIREHGILFKFISNKLKNTFDPKNFEELGKAKKGCTVIICNCDDVETEEIIFKS